MKFKNPILGITASAVIAMSIFVTAHAESSFPNRPISIVVPWGTGGGSDQLTRNWEKAAKEVAPNIDFNVTNMPGANGLIGLNHVMSQPADGYTIYQIVTANYVLDSISGANKYSNADIVPIAGAVGAKDMFYINSSDSRFENWSDVVAYAKENPGELRMAVSSLSGFTNASANGLLRALELDITLVPYPKPAERFGALLGQHADLLFQRVSDVSTFIEAGRIKPVLVFSKNRMSKYPEVPTTVENGAPDSTLVITRGFVMKAGTPEDRLEMIQDIFKRASETNEFQEYLSNQNSDEVYIGSEFHEVLETQFRQLSNSLE